MTIRDEIASSAAKMTPPAAVSAAAKLYGLALTDWVLIATLVYTLLQIAYLLDKWRRTRLLRMQEDEA